MFLHILALWMIVAVLPLFDVLGKSPEFFVAHRTRPGDIWLFMALLSLVVPVVVYAVARASSVLYSRLPRIVAGIFVGTMAAVMTLQLVKQLAGAPATPAFVLAGMAAAAGFALYTRYAGVRSAMTLLAPVIVIVPAVFLWRPGVRSQLTADTVQPVHLDVAETPSVVVMVFDQLPLASLLDANLRIDERQYPNFAGLARHATWFRNASAVSGYTDWALPAIMSGLRPDASRTPVASDYPANLFTLLGTRYELEVFEPLTSLCPVTLCETARASMRRILQDVGIVFLHLIAPGHFADRLPSVTQGWRDFAAGETTGARWEAARLGDRGPVAEAFIDSIGGARGAERPPLVFMHLLLPHEPFVYLPSGQLATSRPTAPGYQSDGTWSGDAIAVRHTYQRHLSQVAYADTLLGRLLTRLRDLGFYDDALIVVAADHGMSFRPRRSVRGLSRDAAADVMSVPLLIKPPRQQSGTIDDSNVETVDVLPTILGVLGAVAPESLDGDDLFAPGRTARETKVFARVGAGETALVDASLLESLAEAVRWKVDLIGGDGSPFAPETAGRYGALVGRPVSDFHVREGSGTSVSVDVPALLASVDPGGHFMPSHVSGSLRHDDAADRPALAVALNGVIRSVTRPFAEPVAGRPDSWAVLIDPGHFEPGYNHLAVLVVTDRPDGSVVLESAWETPADQALGENLLVDGVAWLHRATASGFHDLESSGRTSFRWTDGAARIHMPVEAGREPSTLVVEIPMARPDTHLRISANHCTLADGEISTPWSEQFAIGECVAGTAELTVAITSDTFVPQGDDSRTLGVAVSRIEVH